MYMYDGLIPMWLSVQLEEREPSCGLGLSFPSK